MSFLVGVGKEAGEFGVGVESLGKKSGLLLDFGKVVEVLGLGGVESDGLVEIVNSVLGIAFLGIERGEGVSDFGGIGVELLGTG